MLTLREICTSKPPRRREAVAMLPTPRKNPEKRLRTPKKWYLQKYSWKPWPELPPRGLRCYFLCSQVERCGYSFWKERRRTVVRTQWIAPSSKYGRCEDSGQLRSTSVALSDGRMLTTSRQSRGDFLEGVESTLPRCKLPTESMDPSLQSQTGAQEAEDWPVCSCMPFPNLAGQHKCYFDWPQVTYGWIHSTRLGQAHTTCISWNFLEPVRSE